MVVKISPTFKVVYSILLISVTPSHRVDILRKMVPRKLRPKNLRAQHLGFQDVEFLTKRASYILLDESFLQTCNFQLKNQNRCIKSFNDFPLSPSSGLCAASRRRTSDVDGKFQRAGAPSGTTGQFCCPNEGEEGKNFSFSYFPIRGPDRLQCC